MLELKIIGIGLAIFAVYIIVLYFVNRAKAKMLVKELTERIEWLCHLDVVKGKKDWVYEQFNLLIDIYLVKLPFAKIILKWIVKYALDKMIESNVENINKTVAPLVKETIQKVAIQASDRAVAKLTEKILMTPEPTPNSEVVEMAKILTSTDAKAIYSVFGKVNGNTSKEGVDYEVGAGIAGKIGG